MNLTLAAALGVGATPSCDTPGGAKIKTLLTVTEPAPSRGKCGSRSFRFRRP